MRLFAGNPRQAERRFGWRRQTIAKGLQEIRLGIRCLENFAARGWPRWEEDPPNAPPTCVPLPNRIRKPTPNLMPSDCQHAP